MGKKISCPILPKNQSGVSLKYKSSYDVYFKFQCICPTKDRYGLLNFLHRQPLQMQVNSIGYVFINSLGLPVLVRKFGYFQSSQLDSETRMYFNPAGT
jgi:hypothetical protein